MPERVFVDSTVMFRLAMRHNALHAPKHAVEAGDSVVLTEHPVFSFGKHRYFRVILNVKQFAKIGAEPNHGSASRSDRSSAIPHRASTDATLPAARAEIDTVRQVYNAATGYRIVLASLYGMMNALLSGNFVQVTAYMPAKLSRMAPSASHPCRPTVSMTACRKRWAVASTRSRTEDRPMFFK